MVDALGAVTWWGFSPALDLQEKDIIHGLRDLDMCGSGGDNKLKVLLIGCGDIRHILTTVARSWRHKKRPLCFYVVENNLELYLRQLLLLHLALESPQDMGLQEKTELFLEIYGNTLTRQQTADYVSSRSNEFLRMVTDADYLAQRLPAINFSALKFKERDHLEAILKFWRSPDIRAFDITKCWDNRLRKHLEVRYDSRKGVYDWDYSMKLSDRGRGVMHNQEYNNWRETGVAFELREADYSVQNRTLASGLILRKGGERIAERGYWGDIVCSPYLTYGLESEEESFFKKANGIYTKTCQDVSVYNILSQLHELTYKEKYVMPQPKPPEEKEKKEQSRLVEITEEEEEEEEEEAAAAAAGDDGEKKQQTEEQCEGEGKSPVGETTPADLLPLEDVEIHFLPIGSAPDLPKKGKYRQTFDLVYFSNSMVHHLTPDISAVFADKAAIICETARYMLELKKEQCQEFAKKVAGMAKQAGCQETCAVDGFQHSFMRFSYQRKDS